MIMKTLCGFSQLRCEEWDPDEVLEGRKALGFRVFILLGVSELFRLRWQEVGIKKPYVAAALSPLDPAPHALPSTHCHAAWLCKVTAMLLHPALLGDRTALNWEEEGLLLF